MAMFRAGTWPIQSRMSAGTLHFKNLYNNTFAYTETQHKVAAGTATAIHSGIASSTSSQTVTSGLTDPDVPRCLVVTPTGTTNDVAPSTVRITGTNVEGKVITEGFRFTQDQSTAVNGEKAFRTVTSVSVEAQESAAVTFQIGTLNKLGLNHRLFNQNTTTKVYYSTTVANPTVLTRDTEPTVTMDEVDVELNTILPDYTPDGTVFYVFAYAYDNWSDGSSINDQPEYSITTSTSSTTTSTSTSTITTSTSTSTSKSTSTSTTVSVTTSTSTSVSTSLSTSTSTTTTP